MTNQMKPTTKQMEQWHNDCPYPASIGAAEWIAHQAYAAGAASMHPAPNTLMAAHAAMDELKAERDALKADHEINADTLNAMQYECDALLLANKDLQQWFDALKVDYDALEETNKKFQSLLDANITLNERISDQRDALQAQLEAMRKQEPEMHDAKCPALTGGDCTCNRHNPVVDKAWAQFCAGVGDGPNAPYPGMIGAFERYYGQSFADKDWREESAVWAAAWKAALYTAPQPVNRGLIDALQPFVLANSSEEHITLVVRTSDITKARAAIAAAEKEMK